MDCFFARYRVSAKAEYMGIYMHRIALAALAIVSSIGTAQAATNIGFQPLANASAVPVTYTESGYTIQSNNTREPFPGLIQNSTLTVQNFVGANDTGVLPVNFTRSTSFSLTGGTFTFDSFAAFFNPTNGITNSFTIIRSLFDKQIYSTEFTAIGGAVQTNNIFRNYSSGSSTIFDKLVFTSGASGGSIVLDDIKVSAATIPTPEPTPTPQLPPVTAAVPEPATWAMMVFGFGFIGGTMRRRKQQVAVRYA